MTITNILTILFVIFSAFSIVFIVGGATATIQKCATGAYVVTVMAITILNMF